MRPHGSPPPPVDAAQYAAQVRAARQSPGQIAVTVGALVVAWLLAWGSTRAIDRHLAASLYEPACAITCKQAGGASADHRRGGRGRAGEVDCWCRGPGLDGGQWKNADLGSGSIVDLAFHWGGQEVIAGALFILVAGAGMVAGWRLRRSPTAA